MLYVLKYLSWREISSLVFRTDHVSSKSPRRSRIHFSISSSVIDWIVSSCSKWICAIRLTTTVMMWALHVLQHVGVGLPLVINVWLVPVSGQLWPSSVCTRLVYFIFEFLHCLTTLRGILLHFRLFRKKVSKRVRWISICSLDRPAKIEYVLVKGTFEAWSAYCNRRWTRGYELSTNFPKRDSKMGWRHAWRNTGRHTEVAHTVQTWTTRTWLKE